jgi:hypothetical protein
MVLGESAGGPRGAALLAERSSGLCAERRWSWREAQSRVASAVCQCYDRVLPLAVGEWEVWRFAATSDVPKLRFAVAVVKLRRRARAHSTGLTVLDILRASARARQADPSTSRWSN